MLRSLATLNFAKLVFVSFKIILNSNHQGLKMGRRQYDPGYIYGIRIAGHVIQKVNNELGLIMADHCLI